MILSGSEKMERYPSSPSGKMGILSYGKVKTWDGKGAYKADPASMERLASIGWKTIGNGTSYIYVQKVA